MNVMIGAHIFVLLLASNPGLAAERLLNGDEIRSLLPKIVAVGENSRQIFMATGATTYTLAGSDSLGRWRVQRNRYCSKWPPSDFWACYDVFTNGESPPNTIIWIGDSGKRLINRIEKKEQAK